MGSKLDLGFACVYVGYFEESLFQSYSGPLPRLYKRYIDDVIGVMIGTRDNLDTFPQFVSSFSPSLKFTWSISETSVNFLDLTISVDSGRLSTSIYYTATPQVTHLNVKTQSLMLSSNAYVAFAATI